MLRLEPLLTLLLLPSFWWWSDTWPYWWWWTHFDASYSSFFFVETVVWWYWVVTVVVSTVPSVWWIWLLVTNKRSWLGWSWECWGHRPQRVSPGVCLFSESFSSSLWLAVLSIPPLIPKDSQGIPGIPGIRLGIPGIPGIRLGILGIPRIDQVWHKSQYRMRRVGIWWINIW